MSFSNPFAQVQALNGASEDAFSVAMDSSNKIGNAEDAGDDKDF